jgi:hypothetical protein
MSVSRRQLRGLLGRVIKANPHLPRAQKIELYLDLLAQPDNIEYARASARAALDCVKVEEGLSRQIAEGMKPDRGRG